MSYTKREREDYNRHREHVSKEFGLDKNKYNALRRASMGLSQADIHSTNGSKDDGRTHYTEKEYNKDRAEAFKKAEKVRSKAGGKHAFHFFHQTDPRGVALRIAKERTDHRDYNRKSKPIY